MIHQKSPYLADGKADRDDGNPAGESISGDMQ
jgi:hypothetical protein